MLFKTLRRSEEYDLEGVPWYAYADFKRFCPCCGAQLRRHRHMTTVWVLVFIAHLVFMMRVVPLIHERFGQHSLASLGLFLCFILLLSGIVWLSRAMLGFDQLKNEKPSPGLQQEQTDKFL